MGIIKTLPESVVEKIAAGEVIEKPASIVKELVENSVDASATHIDISFQNGGKRLIRVSDDGVGMAKEDLKASLVHHATSKIECADDLLSVSSYGFRGEALTSIAAVSRLSIKTRLADSEVGYEIFTEGGRSEEIVETGISSGTTVEVKDLFFNTPARRKFLKPDNREAGEIVQWVRKLALVNPQIAFSIRDGEKLLEEYPSNQSMKDRIQSIYRSEWSQEPLEVNFEHEGVQMEAYLGRPQFSRVNRTGQEFFINGRSVSANWLTYMVSSGFGETLPHGRFPVGVVFLTLDPDRLDVNVHPTKREVRVSGERDVQKSLSQGLSQALADQDLFPKINLVRVTETPQTFAESTQVSSSPNRPFVDRVQENLAPGTQASITKTEPQPEATLVMQKQDRLGIIRILGQVHTTYLLAETVEGFIVIDQHAAHERVHYEKMLQSLETGEPQCQRLLLPEKIDLNQTHKEILEQSLQLLENIGFLIEPFGGNTFVVNGVPPFIAGEVKQHLQDFLDQTEEGADRLSVEEQKKALAALVACKIRSVKAGQALPSKAIEALIESLSACALPFTCPHGRPTLIKLTLSELEKQFGRK